VSPAPHWLRGEGQFVDGLRELLPQILVGYQARGTLAVIVVAFGLRYG